MEEEVLEVLSLPFQSTELKIGDIITEIDSLGTPSHVGVFVGEHNRYPSIVHTVSSPYNCVMVTRLKPCHPGVTYSIHRYHNSNVAWLAVMILLIWHVNKVEYQTAALRERFTSLLEGRYRINLDLDRGEKQAEVAALFFKESIEKLVEMSSHLYCPMLPNQLVRDKPSTLEETMSLLESLSPIASDDLGAASASSVQKNLTDGMRCSEAVMAAFNIAQMIFHDALITKGSPPEATTEKILFSLVSEYQFNHELYPSIDALLHQISFPFDLAHHYATASALHYSMTISKVQWLNIGTLNVNPFPKDETEIASKKDWQVYCRRLMRTAPQRQYAAIVEYIFRAKLSEFLLASPVRSQSATDFTKRLDEERAQSLGQFFEAPLGRGRSRSFNVDDAVRESPCHFLSDLLEHHDDTPVRDFTSARPFEVKLRLTPTPPRVVGNRTPSSFSEESPVSVERYRFNFSPKRVAEILKAEPLNPPVVRGFDPIIRAGQLEATSTAMTEHTASGGAGAEWSSSRGFFMFKATSESPFQAPPAKGGTLS